MPSDKHLILLLNGFLLGLVFLLSIAFAYFRLRSLGKPHGTREKLYVLLVGPTLGIFLYVFIVGSATPWLKRTFTSRHHSDAVSSPATPPTSDQSVLAAPPKP